jgi:hypothetical protein
MWNTSEKNELANVSITPRVRRTSDTRPEHRR